MYMYVNCNDHIYALYTGPRPCLEYSLETSYIDGIFEDQFQISVLQIGICIGNTLGDLCYSPYFDDVAADLCQRVDSSFTGV